jgi:hypothetical protein
VQQLSLLDPQLVIPAPPGEQLGGPEVPPSLPDPLEELLELDPPLLLPELADPPLDPLPDPEPLLPSVLDAFASTPLEPEVPPEPDEPDEPDVPEVPVSSPDLASGPPSTAAGMSPMPTIVPQPPRSSVRVSAWNPPCVEARIRTPPV